MATPVPQWKKDQKSLKELGLCTQSLMEERARGYQAQIQCEQSSSSFIDNVLWLGVGLITGYAVHEAYR